MSLIISALTCSLSAILAPQLQEQSAEIPAGMPHPTLPQQLHQWEELNTGRAEWSELRLWHALKPGSLLSGDWDGSYAEARLERADRLAALNEWTDAEMRDWLSATAPKPVRAMISVREIPVGKTELDGKNIFVGSQPLMPGVPTTLGNYGARPVVAEIDVEIAQASNIADPDMGWLFDGVSVAVAVVPLGQDRWWAEFAMTVSEAGESETIDTGSGEIRGKSRENAKVLEFSGPILARNGSAAEIRMPGMQPGSTLAVQLTLTGERQPAIFQVGDYLAVDLPTVPLDPGLATLLDESGDKFLWSSPNGMLIVEAAGGSMIAEELVNSATGVTGVDLGLALETGPDRTMPLVQVPGIVGRDYCFAAGHAYDVLVDWDVEVASESRIPSPIFARLFEGFAGSMRAEADGGGIGGTMLDAEFSRIHMGEPAQLKLAGETYGGGERELKLSPVQVKCERPERHVAKFQWEGSLPSVTISKTLPAQVGYGTLMGLRLTATEVVNR